MFWGGIGRLGLTPLVRIDGRLNSETYTNILAANLLPNAAAIGGHEWVFQQDSASIHTSKHSSAWFVANNVPVLVWPSYSPDMNIIENLWGHMADLVYPNNKQYSTDEALEVACRQAWATISIEYIASLFASMPERVQAVVASEGGPTTY
jgi:hypothetical protein